jgi:alanyl-tRNA synthetase
LMHAALREVLGTHVKQAGSVVARRTFVLTFSHYQPLTQAEREEDRTPRELPHPQK